MKNEYPYLLHRGDAFQFLSSIPDESADALITNPPYSSGGLYQSARTQVTSSKYQNGGTKKSYPEFLGDNRDQLAHLTWYVLWLTESFRVLREGSIAALFTDWRQLPLTVHALQAGGFVWRGIVVWDKTRGARPQRGRFAAQAEYLVWGSKGSLPSAGPCLPGVFSIFPKASEKHHIAGKPLQLFHDLLKIVPQGGLVLDPFMGSGTCGRAAVKGGFQYAGCEMSRSYFSIASQLMVEAAEGTPSTTFEDLFKAPSKPIKSRLNKRNVPVRNVATKPIKGKGRKSGLTATG